MFPTHVGMNRVLFLPKLSDVPHTRGDEPPSQNLCLMDVMFPTHVGMNRRKDIRIFFNVYVPHTRGDEPFF